MLLELKSDFMDYYDHQFDLHGKEFRRMSGEGMNREEMLTFLKRQQLIVPPFGIVKNMKNHALIRDEVYVVVHTDLNSHRGENKILLRYREALKEFPDAFMVLYASSGRGVSWRYLKVGCRSFMLRYESEDWRSNWETKEIEIEMEDASDIQIPKLKPEPLFAIDFVKNINSSGKACMVAIDYNIAPQIRGTGVEELLSAKETVQLITEQWAKNHEKEHLLTTKK